MSHSRQFRIPAGTSADGMISFEARVAADSREDALRVLKLHVGFHGVTVPMRDEGFRSVPVVFQPGRVSVADIAEVAQ